MHARFWLIASLAGAVAVLGASAGPSLRAQAQPADAAVTGVVSSAEEGPMEGVMVSVKRTGSTVSALCERS